MTNTLGFDSTHVCPPLSLVRMYQARDMRHVTLNDGRMICSECLETATMDANDCHRIYVEVKEYYKTLSMEVEERIPVYLVDIFEMKKATEKEDKVNLNCLCPLYRKFGG